MSNQRFRTYKKVAPGNPMPQLFFVRDGMKDISLRELSRQYGLHRSTLSRRAKTTNDFNELVKSDCRGGALKAPPKSNALSIRNITEILFSFGAPTHD